MNDQFPNPGLGEGPGRFIGAVFGLVFFGIGLTVIGFLWGAPFGEFGSPPLVFRIFWQLYRTGICCRGWCYRLCSCLWKDSELVDAPTIGHTRTSANSLISILHPPHRHPMVTPATAAVLHWIPVLMCHRMATSDVLTVTAGLMFTESDIESIHGRAPRVCGVIS